MLLLILVAATLGTIAVLTLTHARRNQRRRARVFTEGAAIIHAALTPTAAPSTRPPLRVVRPYERVTACARGRIERAWQRYPALATLGLVTLLTLSAISALVFRPRLAVPDDAQAPEIEVTRTARERPEPSSVGRPYPHWTARSHAPSAARPPHRAPTANSTAAAQAVIQPPAPVPTTAAPRPAPAPRVTTTTTPPPPAATTTTPPPASPDAGEDDHPSRNGNGNGPVKNVYGFVMSLLADVKRSPPT